MKMRFVGCHVGGCSFCLLLLRLVDLLAVVTLVMEPREDRAAVSSADGKHVGVFEKCLL